MMSRHSGRMPAAELLASAEDMLSRRKLNEALDYYVRAKSAGAARERCAGGKWAVHMLRGDFPAAWAESDVIRGLGKPDPNCLWRGEAINGKRVVVRCLHGFGDAVQFFRYAPRLNAVAEKVVWQVPPEMVELANCCSGIEQAVTWNQEGADLTDWDVQIECMELPNIFRTHLHELPIAANYLRLPSDLVDSIGEQMGRGSGLRIGLVWAAGEWNRSRSIPLKLFSPIVQSSGCEFWNLQGGAERLPGSALPKHLELRDAKPCNQGIVELAGVIRQLDLVITVDTLAAHLAGALGVPAWVLLQYEADWRWLVHRDDSPWYPSLRLFRQPSPGDWRLVLREVEGALLNWVEAGAERVAV